VSEARPYSAAVDRDRLILDHVPLLKHLVGRLSIDLPPTIDRDDLYGFGMIGLIQAADSWDPCRGLKFSTYAYPKIRGAILDELRRVDFLSRGQREKVRELERVVADHEARTGVAPAPEEIARDLGLPPEEVDLILASARSACRASLDDGLVGTLREKLADPRSEDPAGSAERDEALRALRLAIPALPDPERTVIVLYYAEGLLLREIAGVLGVTESRVSQIHTRALYRLNRELAAKSAGRATA
jgi:RNA polymerase sigma factor for flagellar operon FliA